LTVDFWGENNARNSKNSQIGVGKRLKNVPQKKHLGIAESIASTGKSTGKGVSYVF
jgi:hypothetical protein